MLDVKGKRLLILGSTSNIASIVKKAMDMGVYVIVTDNRSLDKAPAKRIANKYYNISLADIDLVVDLIKREKIDGVLTGFTDSYLKYYNEICNKAGLPCYGGETQFGISTDKVKFKRMCRENGVPDIPGGFAYSEQEAEELVKKIGYPIMLKPADNSGSRGVIKCENKNSLHSAYEYALSFSEIHCVICEKYLDCDNIGASYQLENGEIKLTSVSDRHVYKASDGGSSITKDLRYPSIYSERYEKEVNEKFIKMLKCNGFADGMLSIQAFVDKQSFYFCEMCFRPSGGHHYSIVQNQTGIDGMGMLIEYALNGKVEATPAISPYFKKACGMASVIGEAGEVIASIDGIDEITEMDCVIELTQALFPGDKIGKDGTTAQILFYVWYYANDFKELDTLIERIKHMASCKNAEGKNLVKDIRYYV